MKTPCLIRFSKEIQINNPEYFYDVIISQIDRLTIYNPDYLFNELIELINPIQPEEHFDEDFDDFGESDYESNRLRHNPIKKEINNIETFNYLAEANHSLINIDNEILLNEKLLYLLYLYQSHDLLITSLFDDLIRKVPIENTEIKVLPPFNQNRNSFLLIVNSPMYTVIDQKVISGGHDEYLLSEGDLTEKLRNGEKINTWTYIPKHDIRVMEYQFINLHKTK